MVADSSKRKSTEDEQSTVKKPRTSDPWTCFTDGLASQDHHFAEAFAKSGPYKHSVIPALFDDVLLRKVRREITDNLVFSEKETDIYKVNQTGDLANLDGLPADEKAKLINLRTLRDALYSVEFRDWLRRVTGVGPLSGSKIDMSINNYTAGCHLLNHDDVIGTRSISYILYLPGPEDWQPEYGGALELYPVIAKGIPANDPTLVIPPSWNQFIMFPVQPGHSFHSVEEVVAKDVSRLSISGWFHVAQPGEPGHSDDVDASHVREEEQAKSTLLQLLDADDEDFGEYTEGDIAGVDDEIIPKLEDTRLVAHTETLKEAFEESAHLTVDGVIADAHSQQSLINGLRAIDRANGIAAGKMTAHGTGVGDDTAWECQGPPQRHRYAKLAQTMPSDIAQKSDSATTTMRSLFAARSLIASMPFKTFLEHITGETILSRRVAVRRFRPGLDYTLATSSKHRILQVQWSLTPDPTVATAGYEGELGPEAIDLVSRPISGPASEEEPSVFTIPERETGRSDHWKAGEFGGYTCFMQPDDEADQDAAIYRASTSHEKQASSSTGGVLLTHPPSFDRLHIVLKDPGLLAFTKYVATGAGGSCWDVLGEFVVADLDDDGDEDEELQEA
ncbi:putative component of NuA3 histone acetyltransferase complex [Savitreella phatthalungensis]